MAQLAIAAVGAAIGNAAISGTVLGLSGAAIGWSVGSVLGSMLGPTQRSSGPRLGDLKVTGAAYGETIPWIAGHPRVAGQLWWASDRREISTTTDVGGKGGGAEYTEYTYEVDLLIGLADREIAGVSRIWLNGKLIWSALTDADEATFLASVDTDQWRRLTVYTGASDQLPDPTYETAVGIGNAPACRGRGTVFIEGLQLGNSGQIPNLTFEVARLSSAQSSVLFLRDISSYERTITNVSGSPAASYSPAKFRQAAEIGNGGNYYTADGSDGTLDGNAIICAEAWVYATNYATLSRGILNNLINGGLSNGWALNITSGKLTGAIYTANTAVPVSAVADFPLNQWVFVQLIAGAATVAIYQDGVLVGTVPNTTGSIGSSGGNLLIGNQIRFTFAALTGFIDEVRISRVARSTSVPTERFPEPDEDVLFQWRCDARETLTPDDESVQSVVEALCARAGMPAGTYDASALSSITREVRALAVSQVSPARAVLEQLAAAYYFEAYGTDKLYFVPRGGAVALTIDSDDLGAAEGQAADEALPVNITPDSEIPAQVSLSYINVDADYNTATEHSDRLLSGIVSTSTVQMALGLTASEAKGICDTMVMDGYASRIGGDGLALPIKYTRLTPTDVVLATAPDATQYRARLVRRVDAGITCSFEWVLDDATVLLGAGISSSDYTPSLTVSLPGPTQLELLDIPILRDADDAPGIYAALKPAASPWPGAQLFASVSGGDYASVGTATSRAIFGVTTVALTIYTGGNVFDEAGSVTVDVSPGALSSATRDQVLDSDANAMLIGDEVIQFRDATLVTAGVYKLTGLLRGRRGTEWAMTGHAIGERAVLLRTAGLLRVSYEAARIGLATNYKPVTLGKLLSSATAETIIDTGIALKPFAPTGLRVDTSTPGLYTVTWDRRTRLSYRWPSTTAVPLGEASETYEADLLDLTDAVIDTQTVTGAAVGFSTATRTTTLDEGIGYLNVISGAYYGIQAEGSGLRYVLKIDSAGTVASTSFSLGDVSWCLRVNGGQIFATGDVLSSGTPQTVLSSTIWKLDPADITAVAASYTMPTAGDAHGIWHDGTSLWVPGYVSGDLRELNGTTLASVGATALEVGIWAITGDGTYLFITNIDTGDVFAYDPGVGEIWRVTPGSSPFDILVRSGFVYVACADRVVVLNAADGTTVADHAATILSGSFTPALVSFGPYVCFRRTSGYVAFINAGTGAIDFESSIPAMTYLSGADGSTLFTIASPTLSFTDYQTWGYELKATLTGFTVNVYQISATVGRGYPATITL